MIQNCLLGYITGTVLVALMAVLNLVEDDPAGDRRASVRMLVAAPVWPAIAIVKGPRRIGMGIAWLALEATKESPPESEGDTSQPGGLEEL